MISNERMNEINPGGLFQIMQKVDMIWNVVDMVTDDDAKTYFDQIEDLLDEVIVWCGVNIGFRCVGVLSIMEIGNTCRMRVEEAVSVKVFQKEYIYELELFAFVICAYFGVDYRHICMTIGRSTSFDYCACMIYQGDGWISEEECIKESIFMIESYRDSYEKRIMDELSDYVRRRKSTRKKTYGRYNRFYLPTNEKEYDTGSRKYNEEIKERIREEDDFKEYQFDLDFLCNHQKAGCLLAEQYNRFAFFYDTGTGKTIMTLAIMHEKQKNANASFLILAPLAIIENAWLEDASNYFPGMKILPLCSRFKQQEYKDLYDGWKAIGAVPNRLQISSYEWETFLKKSEKDCKNTVAFMKLMGMADHYIVNIEMFRRDPEEFLINKVNGLIIDESALLKNPYTQSSKAIDEYSEEFDFIYLLSGKPAPNNNFEYYMQMRVVDPEDFDMSPADFKQAFFMSGRDGLVFKNERYESIAAAMIAQRSLIVSKEDCLHLKQQKEEILSVTLDSDSMRLYKNVMGGCFQRLAENDRMNGRDYLATSKRLAVVTKLREVTSGFIIDDKKETHFVHDVKVDALVDLISRYPGEQFVIWCNFVYEIEMLSQVLSEYGVVVDAYGKTKQLQKKIAMFKSNKAQFLLAHPKTLKYGVTLVNCQRAVYYSMSYSAEDYYQSHDRIYRMGQQGECHFYFLIAKNTIDETIFECVKNKMGYAEMFQEIVKHAAEHGVSYNEFGSDAVVENNEAISEESDMIQKEYEFAISGDTSFAYVYDGEERNSVLCNTTLSEMEFWYPEEMLFEIGYDVLLGELKNVTYRHITRVSEWVEKQLKRYHIYINKRIKDYLDQQEDKQYQIDIARGVCDEMQQLLFIDA